MQVQYRIGQLRPVPALLSPLLAFALQWLCWPLLDPFAWILFYPAVFFSSWIGGRTAGLAATAISTVLVWLFFIPPQFTLLKASPGSYFSMAVFLGMGVLFSVLQGRLHRANRQHAEALQAAHRVNDQLQNANDNLARLDAKNRELDAFRNQYLLKVSHELCTPLALILGPVGKWLKVGDIGDEQRQDLEVVDRNARLLYRHVSDLLDIARIDAGRLQIRYAQIDLAGLTRFIASHFEALARARGIRYLREIPDALSAQADAEKYQRILLNLLSNAFKFTPDGGEVALGLGAEGDRVFLRVRDNGPSIPEPLREAIFERFRQEENGFERHHGGTGLGLAIVKEFTELHGGRVAVADDGGGALFTVELPMAAAEGSEISAVCVIPDEELDQEILDELRAQPTHAAVRRHEVADDAPLVLVAENNPDMKAFLVWALDGHYRVITAEDGQEGLSKALQLRPDLIVCDVTMPRMSGEQMVEELRQRPETANVPIVMLTTMADDALRQKLLREQVQDYLQKPFPVEELLARVHKLVIERERERERVRFDALVESSPNGIVLVDREGKIANVNSALERMFGYRRDELLGQSVDCLVPERFRERHADYRHGFVAHPEARTMGAGRDLYGLHRDGREFSVEIGLTPLEADQRPMVLATIADITVRRNAEAVLRESEATLRHAQAISHMGSWRLDIATSKMIWSEETYRIFGLPQGAAVDLDALLSRVHPDDQEPFKAAWKATLAGMSYNIEHRIVVGTEEKWVCERAEVIMNAAGQPSIAYGAVQDITARKLMEQCLQEATRRKDEFLALLAHELRNPLAPIRNAVEIMRAIGFKEPRLDWARDIIDRQVTHMTRLVDDLLEVSRITRGKVALIVKTLNLSDVVNQAVELSRPLIDSRKHTLAVQLPSLPIWTRGDLTRLTQVVANLLDNAAKYTPKGGHIALKLTSQEGEAVISVADTGQGIAPDLLPHLFEPFTQGERSLDRTQGGLGLGLTLVKNLVDLHGGRVEAYSPGVGYGAEFRVRLPCRAEGEEGDSPAKATVESAPLAGDRVLLVDNNPDVVNSLAFLFKLKGYAVATAADGPAALRQAQAFDPQVIVLDIGLPGMDGYEVCRQLRAQRPEQGPLIVALTGYGEKKDIERAKGAGFDHHLVKPADPEKLFALIDAGPPSNGTQP